MNVNNQVEEKKDVTVEEDTVIQTNEATGTVAEAAEEKQVEQAAKEEVTTETPEAVTEPVAETQEETTEQAEQQEVEMQQEIAETKEEPEHTPEPLKAEGLSEQEIVDREFRQYLEENGGAHPAAQEPVKQQKVNREKDEELAQYEETFKDYKPGTIIRGTVVGIHDNEVLVDISYKSEVSIPISEFSGADLPEKFSEISVYFEYVDGKIALSKKKADFELAFDKMNEIFKNNEKIKGVIKKRVRGGMIAEIMGIEAFLPGSQISNKPVPNLDHFIGKEMTFKIINLDKEKKNVIVSKRKVMDEEQKEKISKLLDKIYIGAELDGEVKNITDYGAFIDLGGLDGLLHITDMTWGQISHPSEMLNISDKVKVKVIDYKPEEERISLGLKQLVPHPWENIEVKYEEGTKVTAKVVNLTPYGAFVELEPGVEGLVHISEMSWTKRISHPRQLLNVGDTVDAIVLYASKEDRRISLGVKQMEANPWLAIDERYPEGTIIKGKIKSLTPFGAFIELERDIDGLVHISDMSWTRRISHPKEVLKKGQEVEAIILSIDKHLHRIAMGMKQLTLDPWSNLNEIMPVNTEVQGKIIAIIPKGVLVQVEVEDLVLEGFVPISHLAIPRLEKPELAFSIGDVIPMKVIELDMENRRLIFSVKAYLFSKDREVLQDFLAKHEPSMKKQAEFRESQRKQKEAKKHKDKKREVRHDEVRTPSVHEEQPVELTPTQEEPQVQQEASPVQQAEPIAEETAAAIVQAEEPVVAIEPEQEEAPEEESKIIPETVPEKEEQLEIAASGAEPSVEETPGTEAEEVTEITEDTEPEESKKEIQ